MRSFSQRYGYKPVRELIQSKSIDSALSNELWDIIYSKVSGMCTEGYHNMWREVFGRPIDEIPRKMIRDMRGYNRTRIDTEAFRARIRDFYFNVASWEEKYDILEYLFQFNKNQTGFVDLPKRINIVLTKHLADVRFIDGELSHISDHDELVAVEEALKNSTENVREHLNKSLRYLSDRQKPDYRNSVKEAVSAVEAVCREMTGQNTLGKALNELSKTNKIPKVLISAWDKLYAYTNNKSGIRHALMDDDNLDQALAKFFFLSCTSFINYLRTLNAE